MKNTMGKWLISLAILTVGLGLMGCDKLSSILNTPEAKPVAPANSKVKVKPTAPANSKVKVKPTAPSAAGREAFVSELGNFQVTLPQGFPDFTLTDETDQDSGEISLSYMSEKHGLDACLIMVNSQASWDGMDPKVVLDAGRDGGVSSNEGNTLEREVDFILSGFPGRRIFLRQQSGSAGYFIRDDIVLVKDRLYQIMYISNKKSDLNTPKIIAYFNSFKLTDAPEAGPVREAPESVSKRRLEFTLPSDWIAQNDSPVKNGTNTTLMDFSKGEDVRGLYIMSQGVGNAGLDDLIPAFMGGVESTDDGAAFDDFETLKSTQTGWGGRRCDCRATRSDDGAVVYWSNVFIVLDGSFHVVSIVTLDDNIQKYQSDINRFFDSIVVH